jgi:starch synthase
MRVLMIASEAAPFAKTGGLADVVAALPRALARLGHAIDVVIPRYRGIDAGELVGAVDVPVDGVSTRVPVFALQQDGVRTLFVESAALYGREHLYGPPEGDYEDNPVRFAVLAQTALAWAARTGATYDVVHTHDWQTALVPLWLRGSPAPALRKLPVVLTIHNLAYQGLADASWLPRMGLDRSLMHVDALEFWGRISLLKGGIVFSDYLTTVSPQYAREIQTPAYGFGFEGLLQPRSSRLAGILNGIDYDQWDPSRDAYLPEPFDASRLEGKVAAKRLLLASSGLSSDETGLQRPVVGMISRMVNQKGLDLLVDLAAELPALGASFVVLGEGERKYEDFWRTLAARYPDRVSVTVGFDEARAHRIEGGSDLFLMPSRFEPCGLNQMYSQRYGTVPVVHATGGLRDTVRNYDPATGGGSGFSFDDYSAAALLATLRRALEVYRDREQWRRLQIAGMRQDFSWERSARAYLDIYGRAAARRS